MELVLHVHHIARCECSIAHQLGKCNCFPRFLTLQFSDRLNSYYISKGICSKIKSNRSRILTDNHHPAFFRGHDRDGDPVYRSMTHLQKWVYPLFLDYLILGYQIVAMNQRSSRNLALMSDAL